MSFRNMSEIPHQQQTPSQLQPPQPQGSSEDAENAKFQLINNPREKIETISAENLPTRTYFRVLRIEAIETERYSTRLSVVLKLNNVERRLYLSKSYLRPITLAALNSLFESVGLFVGVTEIIRSSGSRIFCPIFDFKPATTIKSMVEKTKASIDSNYIDGFKRTTTTTTTTLATDSGAFQPMDTASAASVQSPASMMVCNFVIFQFQRLIIFFRPI